MQAWREQTNVRAIEILPGFRWCSNAAQCRSGQQLEDCDNNPIMICYTCGAKVIFWGAPFEKPICSMVTFTGTTGV